MYTSDVRLRILLLLTMEGKDLCNKWPKQLGQHTGKMSEYEARIFRAIDIEERLLIQEEQQIRALLKRLFDEAERLSRQFGG